MNYTAFYDDVLVDCARCPLPVALQAVRLAVIELCDKSGIWTYTSDDEAAVANQSDYELSPPSNTEVVSLLGGYFNNDTFLEAKSQDWLDQTYGKWQTYVGAPRYTTQDAPFTVLVVPFPDTVASTDAFRFRMSVRPTRASTSFDPDGIFCNDFYQEILSGAKYRLMISPGKPYSNTKIGEFHLKQWIAGINRARLQAMRGRGRAQAGLVIPRTI